MYWPSAEFAKPPQNKLSVGSFPETLHGEIEIICADMSHQALMETSRMSLSKQILLNAWNLVIQVTLLQQTFLISFGIGLHTLHLHHSGEVSPGLGGGGGGGAFFSSKLPLPIDKTFLRRYAMSSLWRGARDSCVKKLWNINLLYCCQHLYLNNFTSTPHFFKSDQLSQTSLGVQCYLVYWGVNR